MHDAKGRARVAFKPSQEAIEARLRQELTPSQRREMFQRLARSAGNVAYIKLTQDCSGKCPFCNVWARNGPTDYMPVSLFDAVADFFAARERSNNWNFYLHDDSDACDYLRILHVVERLSSIAQCAVFTSIPPGSEHRFVSLFEAALQRPKTLFLRVSMSFWNRRRLKADPVIGTLLDLGRPIKDWVNANLALMSYDETRMLTIPEALKLAMQGVPLSAGESATPISFNGFPFIYLPLTEFSAALLEIHGRDFPNAPVVTSQWELSELVRRGRLNAGDPVRIGFYPRKHYLRPNIHLLELDWSLERSGRLHPNRFISPTCDATFITCTGGIVRRSGGIPEEIFPPLIEPMVIS